MQGQVDHGNGGSAPVADGGARGKNTDTAETPFRSLADEVRQQGDIAARAGQSPTTCPYRAETSQARFLWLEGYLAAAEQIGRLEKHIAASLLHVVRVNRAGANVVHFGGGL